MPEEYVFHARVSKTSHGLLCIYIPKELSVRMHAYTPPTHPGGVEPVVCILTSKLNNSSDTHHSLE